MSVTAQNHAAMESTNLGQRLIQRHLARGLIKMTNIAVQAALLLLSITQLIAWAQLGWLFVVTIVLVETLTFLHGPKSDLRMSNA